MITTTDLTRNPLSNFMTKTTASVYRPLDPPIDPPKARPMSHQLPRPLSTNPSLPFQPHSGSNLLGDAREGRLTSAHWDSLNTQRVDRVNIVPHEERNDQKRMQNINPSTWKWRGENTDNRKIPDTTYWHSYGTQGKGKGEGRDGYGGPPYETYDWRKGTFKAHLEDCPICRDMIATRGWPVRPPTDFYCRGGTDIVSNKPNTNQLRPTSSMANMQRSPQYDNQMGGQPQNNNGYQQQQDPYANDAYPQYETQNFEQQNSTLINRQGQTQPYDVSKIENTRGSAMMQYQDHCNSTLPPQGQQFQNTNFQTAAQRDTIPQGPRDQTFTAQQLYGRVANAENQGKIQESNETNVVNPLFNPNNIAQYDYYKNLNSQNVQKNSLANQTRGTGEIKQGNWTTPYNPILVPDRMDEQLNAMQRAEEIEERRRNGGTGAAPKANGVQAAGQNKNSVVGGGGVRPTNDSSADNMFNTMPQDGYEYWKAENAKFQGQFNQRAPSSGINTGNYTSKDNPLNFNPLNLNTMRYGNTQPRFIPPRRNDNGRDRNYMENNSRGYVRDVYGVNLQRSRMPDQ